MNAQKITDTPSRRRTSSHKSKRSIAASLDDAIRAALSDPDATHAQVLDAMTDIVPQYHDLLMDLVGDQIKPLLRKRILKIVHARTAEDETKGKAGDHQDKPKISGNTARIGQQGERAVRNMLSFVVFGQGPVSDLNRVQLMKGASYYEALAGKGRVTRDRNYRDHTHRIEQNAQVGRWLSVLANRVGDAARTADVLSVEQGNALFDGA